MNISFSLAMQLLKIRYFQLKRDLSYWTFIIATVVFLITLELSGLKEMYVIAFTCSVGFMVFNYHVSRRDLDFIKRYFDSPQKQLIVNYNIFILPVSLGLLFGVSVLYFLLLHVLVSATAFAETKFRSLKLLFIGRYISPFQFEWISGLRINFYVLILLILIALILSPVKLFALVALFLVNTVFLGFYNAFEPLIMLNPEHADIQSFLNRKINYFIKMILLTNLPILIVNSFFNPDAISFNFFFLLGFMLLAGSCVYIKYASYKPNEQSAFNVDFIILIASVFIPYLLPVGLIIYYNNKRKAKQNLLHYLDDNN